MGVIRVLSDHVANKIAAGEVIERPAAVVKELIENALDAGAGMLRLEVEGGGRRRIRLTDDGVGMVRDDALLALERHATSKLRDVEDLDAIATLGFRGEALPSIAAVSQFTLETAPATGPGTRIVAAGGTLRRVEEAGLPPGTSIEVARLFFNVPARRKFLKSEATELGHITTLVTHYALAYPEIHFRLETPQRLLLEAEPVPDHGRRLRQIFGAEMAEQLIEFRDIARWPEYPESYSPGAVESGPGGDAPPPESEAAADDPGGGLGIFGYASRPELQKLNRNSIFLFVNRRLVRDRLLQHAVAAAYANLLPNQVFPAVLLFLDLPYGEVDVNVHPSKTEVRFRRQGFVHDAVRDAIRKALGVARPVPSFLQEMRARPTAGLALANPLIGELGIGPADLGPDLVLSPGVRPVTQSLPFTAAAVVVAAEARAESPAEARECGAHAPAPPLGPVAEELGQLRPLGQIHRSFIVAAGPSGLWLVDQHVAHERVLFERIEAQRITGTVESQGLLTPQIIGLDPGRWAAFGELAPELQSMGFDVEPFGGRSVAVKSMPAGLAPERAAALLGELLEVAEGEDRALSLEALRTKVAATIACHAAIKINMHLEPEKMNWLLGALARTRFPMTCPHGRPVLLRYSVEEIQRAFKRIK